MIRPLRQRHRVMTILLGVIVVPLFVLALLNREPVEVQNVDAALSPEIEWSDYSYSSGTLSFSGWEQQVHVSVRKAEGKPFVLQITVLEPLKVPNPLLYWQPGENFDGAVLIGAFPTVKERFLELPKDVDPAEGQFVVYSLGHQEVVARATLKAEASR